MMPDDRDACGPERAEEVAREGALPRAGGARDHGAAPVSPQDLIHETRRKSSGGAM